MSNAPRVGFLGPAGTFSEQAMLRLCPDAQGVPVPSIVTLIEAVAGRAHLAGWDGPPLAGAVVPIENSTEGGVGATLDTLADHDELTITAELDLPIEQLLLARPGVSLDQVTQIYSHPQGLAQARRFLARELPHVPVVPVSSTAEGVQIVARSPDRALAAIGSRFAADAYGCTVLADQISEEVNVTRFVLVQPAADLAAGAPPLAATNGDGPRKTTVLFAGAGDGSPGWLVRCLSEFAFRGVNLTKIESRPQRSRLGHYRFFADLEGNPAVDEPVAAAIEGLRHHCDVVRILGGYPVAATAATNA